MSNHSLEDKIRETDRTREVEYGCMTKLFVGFSILLGSVVGLNSCLSGDELSDDSGNSSYLANTKNSVIPTGNLRGHAASGLISRYFDITVFEENVNFNFEEVLQNMWEDKLANSTNKSAVEHVMNNQLQQYNKNTTPKSNLESFIQYQDNVINSIKQDYDFEALANEFRLTETQKSFVQNRMQRVDGKHLTAISMTELLPSSNGTVNANIYDLLLRSVGPEGISLIPAMGDGFLSFGPYQHTSYVVRDANGIRGDANIFMAHAKESEFPGSMKHMTLDDQIKAAYGNAIIQSIRLSKRIQDGSLIKLEEALPGSLLAGLIGALHYNPANTARDIRRNLAAGGNGIEGITFAKSYNRKTINNFEGIARLSDLEPGINTYLKEAEKLNVDWSEYSDWQIFEVKNGIMPLSELSTIEKKFENCPRGYGALNVRTEDGKPWNAGDGVQYIIKHPQC